MLRIRKSTKIGGVAAATLAVMLGLTVGSPAYAAPSEPSSGDGLSVADSNEAAIDATLATIDDPAQQDTVRAWMEEATADGAQIAKAQTGNYTPTTGGEVSTLAYPSGCGLFVLILRNGQTITNDTLTSCTSGPYQFLTHEMRITAYDGVFGVPNEVTGVRVFNYAGGTSDAQEISWTCANYNQTSFNAISRGIMAKNGEEYTTPTVYDTFDGNIDCGY